MSAAAISDIPIRRTERHQTADVLWLLIANDFIVVTAKMTDLCETLGISTRDLTLARCRFEDGERLSPRPWQTIEGGKAAPSDWVPRPSGRHGRAVVKRVLDKNPSPGLRRCPGCARTLSVTDFDRKTPKGTTLRSRCRSCVKRYQRDRYLTIRKAQAVDAAVAFFTALHGDVCIGMLCPACGDPIVEGEQVSLEAAPRHAHHDQFKSRGVSVVEPETR